MKDKLLLTVLVVLLATSLFACSSSSLNEETSTPSTSGTAATASPESSPTKSIAELGDSYKEYILAHFKTCEVSYNNHDIIVTVSSDGLASSLGAIKVGGDNSSWIELKSNLTSKVNDWLEEAKEAGYTDVSVTFAIQNDTATDEYLLKIRDNKIVYDALSDDKASLPTQPPIPDPVVYTGSGDSVVTLDPFEGEFVFHVVGNQSGRHFAVKGYDSSGKSTGLFVNTTSAYDGVTIDPDQETATLEVSATGAWTIEVQSIFSMETISSGETLSGSGDSVVLVSSYGKTATISGNPDSHHFAVKSYGKERNKLLVNTTDEYSGTVMLTGDPYLLEVSATGAWSISFD